MDEKLLREFVDWLETGYYDEKSGSWSKNQSDEDVSHSTYDFGNSYQLCLPIQAALEEAGHSVVMVGSDSSFFPDDSVGSGIGLDWLFVDNRYVVDPWSYTCNSGIPIILDLQNPSQAQFVKDNYPTKDHWEPAARSDKMDLYAGIWTNFILPRAVVGQMLDQ